MNEPDINPLVCPVCRAALIQNERQYCCPEGHSFDVARQGYLNLLLSHRKPSKHPGDNKQMITARQTFLNEGHYLPIYAALERLVLKHLKESEQTQHIADLGCGEGYYTHLLHEKLLQSFSKNKPVQTWGLDISKEAVLNACRNYPNVKWLVANLAHSPFADSSMDILTVLFCTISENELVRLLKPGGTFILVKPNPGHLIQLREQLYTEVKDQDSATENESVCAPPIQHPELKLVDCEQVNHRITLEKPESIHSLFKMTPHYWRTKPAEQEKIMRLNKLETDISVSLFCYQLKT